MVALIENTFMLQAAYDKLHKQYGFTPDQLADWPSIKYDGAVTELRFQLSPGKVDTRRYNAMDLQFESVAVDFKRGNFNMYG